jgi:hypothetical protein
MSEKEIKAAAMSFDEFRGEPNAIAMALLDARAEIRRLNNCLITMEWQRDRHANDAMKLIKVLADVARLDWLADSQEIEGFANDSKDLYEYAAIVADERGNSGDLTDTDLRKGFRRMIDAAMAVQPLPSAEETL